MSRNKYPEETVNLILDVSERLFLEKGYEHTTIQDIIDNLGGLTKGAIYHHFKSKEEILTSVIDRIFSQSTLVPKWNKIREDKEMLGADKLKAILYEGIIDEQEQKYRQMAVNLKNMPQMLANLLVYQVNDAAPYFYEPIITEGIRDGSITAENPRELAEMIALLGNIWMNPLIFPVSADEMKRKFEVLCRMMRTYGIDISELYSALDNMNKEINANR